MRPLLCAGLAALALTRVGASAVRAQRPSAASLPVHEDSIVTADSVRLYYRVVGTGRETVIAPLALFHTTRLDGLARGRRLVLYDPRGRGRSAGVPPEKVSLDHNLRDLDAIRAAVGAERVALIGWSGLGMELFVYALRHPDRVTRLVQLAPVAPRWTPYSALMMADRLRRTDTAALQALDARVARGEFAGRPRDECRARAAVNGPVTFAVPGSARLAPDVCVYPNEWPATIGRYFGALMRSIDGFDWRDSLAKVSGVPRLVVHGAQDNTPVEGNREWVEHQPNARLLVVPQAGHWPQYERPDVVLPAMAAFLEGTWPAGSVQVP
jgi:pimeloyl-ACP methyl ester carboxylesterase